MIRHSALPKLAVCPRYEGKQEAGEAAKRGSRLDAAFRDALQGREAFGDLTASERESVLWAVAEVRKLALGEPIVADEEKLKVKTPGMEHIGTEDARVPGLALSFDLKSGMIRNYREQMAAYALGNMEAYFCERWGCVLLFLDQREAVTLDFSYQDAERIVNGVLDRASDPEAKPRACDYCGWCAKQDTCPEVVGPVVEVKAVVESGVDLAEVRERLLAEPEKLGAFLKAASVFQKELVDKLKEGAKDILVKGGSVPGWKLQNRKGSEYFDHVAVVGAAVAGNSGLDALVLAMGGTMGGKEYRAWCEKMGVPVREEAAHRKSDAVSLVEAKK